MPPRPSFSKRTSPKYEEMNDVRLKQFHDYDEIEEIPLTDPRLSSSQDDGVDSFEESSRFSFGSHDDRDNYINNNNNNGSNHRFRSMSRGVNHAVSSRGRSPVKRRWPSIRFMKKRFGKLVVPLALVSFVVVSVVLIKVVAPFIELHHDDPNYVKSPEEEEEGHHYHHHHDDEGGNPHAIIAEHGAAATDHELCSQIAVDILKSNGSAVDAAIAAGICVGVVNPFNSGIGGGGFMVHRHSNGSSLFFNFREMSPKLANKTMFNHDEKSSLIGGLAVGIPGEIRGYEEAHKRFGKLPWKRLFEPSIKLCEDGFVVSKTLHSKIEHVEEHFKEMPALGKSFAPDGKILKEGDLLTRNLLGKTLKMISDEGPDVFYKGKIMKDSVQTIKEHHGIITEQDYADFHVEIKEPLVGWVYGRKVFTAPPPASGAVLLSMMNILEGYDVINKDLLTMHRTVEAFKHAYAQRSYYGDPNYSKNVTESVEYFKRKEYAEKDKTFPSSYYNATFYVPDTPGTTHISVLGPDGDAASMTLTINMAFGSKIVCERTGIVFNNEMDDFSIPGRINKGAQKGLPPSPFNYVEPGKRPFSSTCPTIIEYNGKPAMIIGGAGGSRIPTAVYQVFQNIFRFRTPVYEAVQAPRLHHQLYPNEIDFESSYGKDLANHLHEDKGHNITWMKNGKTATTVSVVYQKKGSIFAASDERRGGIAAGF